MDEFTATLILWVILPVVVIVAGSFLTMYFGLKYNKKAPNQLKDDAQWEYLNVTVDAWGKEAKKIKMDLIKKANEPKGWEFVEYHEESNKLIFKMPKEQGLKLKKKQKQTVITVVVVVALVVGWYVIKKLNTVKEVVKKPTLAYNVPGCSDYSYAGCQREKCEIIITASGIPEQALLQEVSDAVMKSSRKNMCEYTSFIWLSQEDKDMGMMAYATVTYKKGKLISYTKNVDDLEGMRKVFRKFKKKK